MCQACAEQRSDSINEWLYGKWGPNTLNTKMKREMRKGDWVGGGWWVVNDLRYLLGEVRSLDQGNRGGAPHSPERKPDDSFMHGLGEPAAVWGWAGGLWRPELKSCWWGHPGEPDKVKIVPSQIKPVPIKEKSLRTCPRKWL